MVLSAGEALKGKAPAKTLPVLLKGNEGAIKRKEPAQLLERLAEKLPVVIFLVKREEERVGLAYSNGTWFSLEGVTVGTRVGFAYSETLAVGVTAGKAEKKETKEKKK